MSESHLRLIDPTAVPGAAVGLEAGRAGRLPWRLRVRLLRVRLAFRLSGMRALHQRMVQARLRLRLRWIRWRHGRRVPGLLSPPSPPAGTTVR